MQKEGEELSVQKQKRIEGEVGKEQQHKSGAFQQVFLTNKCLKWGQTGKD